MSADLVSRLSETLDELERVAQAATDGPWIFDGDSVDVEPSNRGDYVARFIDDTWDGPIRITPENGVHIACWDPQVVLRLVGAVRDIIAAYVSARDYPAGKTDPEVSALREGLLYGVLHALAIGFGIIEEAGT